MFSSPLQTAVDALLERKGVQWLTGGFDADNVDKYARFLSLAKKEIRLASDDLNPILFEKGKVVQAIEQFLNQEGKLQVIIHRGCGIEMVVPSFGRTNPRLYHLWVSKREHFAIYWSPIFLRQPFVVTDLGVLFEIPETKENKTWQAFSIRDKKLAKEWDERFDKYITEGHLRSIHPS